MTPRTTVAALLLCCPLILLTFPGCSDNDDSSAPQPIQGFHHDSHGCALRSAPLDTCLGRARVDHWTHAADTLRVSIQFESNCCPGFVAEALHDGETIRIAVDDTLHGCRCLCPYVDDFVIPWTESGRVRLSFRSTSGGGACASGLDTLLTIP